MNIETLESYFELHEDKLMYAHMIVINRLFWMWAYVLPCMILPGYKIHIFFLEMELPTPKFIFVMLCSDHSWKRW